MADNTKLFKGTTKFEKIFCSLCIVPSLQVGKGKMYTGERKCSHKLSSVSSNRPESKAPLTSPSCVTTKALALPVPVTPHVKNKQAARPS